MQDAWAMPSKAAGMCTFGSGQGWAICSTRNFWVLLLRRSNHVLAEVCISRGGLTGTVVDPKIVFGRALAMRAAALVLVHNHPSGNPKPSDADRALTQNLCRAGEFLDLPVLDHVIVAGDGFVSFADQGWLR